MKKKQQKGAKLLQNMTSVFLALLLTVFLFYVGPEGYQGITGAKYSAFLALCIGYIGVMVLLLAECALVGAVKLPTTGALWRHSNWCQRFAVVYLAATWISAVVSPPLAGHAPGGEPQRRRTHHYGLLSVLSARLRFWNSGKMDAAPFCRGSDRL